MWLLDMASCSGQPYMTARDASQVWHPHMAVIEACHTWQPYMAPIHCRHPWPPVMAGICERDTWLPYISAIWHINMAAIHSTAVHSTPLHFTPLQSPKQLLPTPATSEALCVLSPHNLIHPNPPSLGTSFYDALEPFFIFNSMSVF